MIPHKVLNIRCYICTYLALFFIFVFIRLLEYQILQFHAFSFMEALDTNLHIGRLINQTLKARSMTYAQFARLLHCDDTTVYHLVQR